MHEVLVNCLVKLIVRLTDHLDMTIAVDLKVKPQTKQNKESSDGNKNVFICKSNDCQKLIKHYQFLVIKTLGFGC